MEPFAEGLSALREIGFIPAVINKISRENLNSRDRLRVEGLKRVWDDKSVAECQGQNFVFAGRGLIAYNDAANLIASGCYIVVTLLFYDLFKPINKRLSLLAAFSSFVGCAFGALSAFHLAPAHINNLMFFGFYCLLIGYFIFRFDLPAKHSGSIDGVWRFGMADLFVATARKLPVPLQCGTRTSRGNSAHLVASHHGRARRTMETAGQRRS